MTVSVAWTRTLSEHEELMFVSDSRLGGDGRRFDQCPKLFTFPRGDCAIGFAGYTGNAYPLAVQAIESTKLHGPSMDRALDLVPFCKHLIKVFGQLVGSIHSNWAEPTDVVFLFGGYSWKQKRFRLWRVGYSCRESCFVRARALDIIADRRKRRLLLNHQGQDLVHRKSTRYRRLGSIAFAGDRGDEAKARLVHRVSAKWAKMGAALALDMEPFEVVRDMLLDAPAEGTIGGAPQLVKVWPHMNARPQAVLWPEAVSGALKPHVLGRPPLPSERTDAWQLDPFRFRVFHEKHSQEAEREEAIQAFSRAMLLRVLGKRYPEIRDWSEIGRRMQRSSLNGANGFPVLR